MRMVSEDPFPLHGKLEIDNMGVDPGSFDAAQVARQLTDEVDRHRSDTDCACIVSGTRLRTNDDKGAVRKRRLSSEEAADAPKRQKETEEE